jgi:hypothetical protein
MLEGTRCGGATSRSWRQMPSTRLPGIYMSRSWLLRLHVPGQRTDFSSVCLKMPPVGEPDGERDCPGDPGRRAEGADVGDAPCHDEDDGANEAERKGTK